MHILIAGIGRLKAGPERELTERYLERARRAGRAASLEFDHRTWPEARAGTAAARCKAEAAILLEKRPPGARLVALDARGEEMSSETFATALAAWRDAGTADVMIAIGGPDGHGAALTDAADRRLAFGRQTWPHQLVHLMLAEQLYRATTILTGHPYHRG